MPARDLGTKHVCFKCGTKFYDLKKSDPTCPKCGADPRQSPAVKAPPAERRPRATARPVAAPVEDTEAEAELEEDAEADDVDEDVDDGDEP